MLTPSTLASKSYSLQENKIKGTLFANFAQNYCHVLGKRNKLNNTLHHFTRKWLATAHHHIASNKKQHITIIPQHDHPSITTKFAPFEGTLCVDDYMGSIKNSEDDSKQGIAHQKCI